MLIQAQRNALTGFRISFLFVWIIAIVIAIAAIDGLGGLLVGAVGGLIMLAGYKLGKRTIDGKIEELNGNLYEVETGMKKFVKRGSI